MNALLGSMPIRLLFGPVVLYWSGTANQREFAILAVVTALSWRQFFYDVQLSLLFFGARVQCSDVGYY